MRGQREIAKPPYSAQTGWSVRRNVEFRRSDHPVRSNKGSFAPSLFMSRPPLLCEEGNVAFTVKFQTESPPVRGSLGAFSDPVI